MFTGYLIIYNVFQISVTNDIRFYGLLKTIGTTGRQIKALLRQQALLLSCIGIPIGLVLGWMVGGLLAPMVIQRLDGVVSTVSVHPLIFVGSALFALFTGHVQLIFFYKKDRILAFWMHMPTVLISKRLRLP